MENKISSRIKELRTSLNMTQATFSESIGTSQNALSGYENKDRIPSYDILLSIATKYNVSLDWLCGLSNKKAREPQFKTYADIFEYLVKICSTQYVDTQKEKNIMEPSILDSSQNVHFIVRDDANFTTFFSEWEKMYELLNDKTIDEKLYNLWLNDKLSQYNRPINGVPF